MFSHIFLSLKFIVRRCKGKRDLFDNGLKLFLSPEDTEKLHDFEEESVEDFFRDKEQKFQSSSDERIRVINERVEGMAMRMDDFTQKENTIKLSLQTVDYRLSKLEDLCIHTSEMTQQIRNYIARSSRNVSMSSSGSHCRLESEDETPLAPGEFTFYQDLTVKADTGQGSDRSLSVTEAVRSLPSPLLVHSRRPVKDDFLRKYTDYTVQSSQVSPRHSTERQWSQKVRRSSIPIISLTSETHSPLHLRRHVPDTLTVNVEKANVYSPQGSPSQTPDLLMQQKLTPPTAEVAVSQDSEVDTNVNASLYSTAHLSSSMVMTTSNQSDVPRVEVEHTEVPVAQIPHYEEKEQIHPPTSPEKLFVHSSSIFTYPTSGSYTTSTSVVPILTSFHTAEYTTITDEIDTSCMIDRSPPGSPTSGGAFFPDGFFDPDKQHHQKYNKEAREKEFKKLKNAEETEHRKMEKVIRNRLRQISLDETDSISDIAKLVVTELNMTEEEHNGHFEEDNEELHSSTESVVERVVDKLQKPVDITIGDSSSDIES